MGPAAEQRLLAALALPEQERLELVEALLDSHASSDELPFDPAWLNEVRRRSADVEVGGALLDSW
jgi:putative addiction module component (TIGR02574 family)